MSKQENIEKVIKGLEICSAGEWNSTGGRDHTSCPYYPDGYTGCTCKLLMRDALAFLRLLREQEKSIENLYQYIFRNGSREIQKSDVDTAFGIIEDILDDLIEVGNGTTDKMLHADADKLFGLRYYLHSIFHPDKLDRGEYQHDKRQWEAAKRDD